MYQLHQSTISHSKFCWRYGNFGDCLHLKTYNGNLYVGTNQGLFYKKYQTSDEFKFISGTKGQVWSLFEQEGTLFAVMILGDFVVKTPLQKIYFRLQEREIWDRSQSKRTLLQGNYYGLSVLSNNQWTFRNKIAGFDYSSKYFEIMNNLNVL
jgi:hypothetical protein